MSKHTKGPWVIDWAECKTGDEVHWRVPRSIGPISPDHNHWSGPYLDVEEPDAYLIAAAPDLLEALEVVLKAIAFGDPVSKSSLPYHLAKAAITKAKGE